MQENKEIRIKLGDFRDKIYRLYELMGPGEVALVTELQSFTKRERKLMGIEHKKGRVHTPTYAVMLYDDYVRLKFAAKQAGDPSNLAEFKRFMDAGKTSRKILSKIDGSSSLQSMLDDLTE